MTESKTGCRVVGMRLNIRVSLYFLAQLFSHFGFNFSIATVLAVRPEMLQNNVNFCLLLLTLKTIIVYSIV